MTEWHYYVTVSESAEQRVGGTIPDCYGGGAAVGFRQAAQSNGLVAAHLRGPRFIMHALDHLLSPVPPLYQI